MIPLAAFLILTQQCAPAVAPATMEAIVQVESGFNPYAIGVVNGRLERQPATLDEAVATTRALDAAGWNYSVGLAQLNRSNWTRFGLTSGTVFDPCRNLAAGAAILRGCFERARQSRERAQDALRAGLSCYASGDFFTGFRTGYVQRVLAQVVQTDPGVPATGADVPPVRVIPVRPVGPHPDTSHTSSGADASTDHGRNHQTDEPGSMTQQSAVVF
ncbi:lytic transglycosylase domain-containing protein [Paraburkholderia nodosa]|uniref:lytic transglycosylase domain-containing protein n=1 Tax=Paraburkholderia nodosa TaxID=392320 RepID=UPI00048375E9|nr:lytic transglycosylase domain-containing protein [Paraburkholderia nodosa]